MKEKMVSFLMAANNEEKIIGKTLKNLVSLPYKNYEVLIGLDGCTDRTEDIVKKFAKMGPIRWFKLNLRSGKPAVINKIIKEAKGEIIIINDADWIFRVENSEDLIEYLSVFDNPEIGGIAESFPVEWDKSRLDKAGPGYKMTAYANYYWIDYQKKRYSKKNGKFNLVSNPAMFLTNVFRKDLYRKNDSLGDDFERTMDIISQEKKIAIFNSERVPRMVASYDEIKIKDIWKQKIRTAIARKQLSDSGKGKFSFSGHYFPMTLSVIVNSWKSGFNAGILSGYWVVINLVGIFYSKFSKRNTREGWGMRAQRG